MAGHRTYFVLSRRKSRHNSCTTQSYTEENSLKLIISPPSNTHQHHTDNGIIVGGNGNGGGIHYNGFVNGVQLSQSAVNISAIHPSVPPASPVGQQSASLNPSPILSQRPRIASFHKVTKYLASTAANHAADKKAKDELIITYPKIIVSTRSLPESLQSETDDEGCCRRAAVAAATAVAKSKDDDNKYTNKFRSAWKVPKFLRKFDDSAADQKPTSSSSSSAVDVILNCKKMIANDDPQQLQQQSDQNGACQALLSIVIESPAANNNAMAQPHTIGHHHNMLDVPNNHRLIPSQHSFHCSHSTSRSPENSSSSPGPHSMFDEIIDVRSYISQSRSDISPFGRTGSYRSQSGTASRSYAATSGGGAAAATDEIAPLTRPRALTVHSPAAGTTANPWDVLSSPSAAHSRKDSGIRSNNSRRSSIQQQIYVMNQSALSQQRVSGYFTSSQSSLAGGGGGGGGGFGIGDQPPEPVTTPAAQNPDPLGACLQQLRKQSDLQLIRCVRDNAKSQRSYLVKPPISTVSLFFKSRQMEREFRGNAHRFGCEHQYEGPPTLATPKYNTYIDILVGMLVYFAISASLFLLSLSETNATYATRVWVGIFALFSVAQFVAVFIFTKQICHFRAIETSGGGGGGSAGLQSCDDNIFDCISKWYPWHICLSILMALPVVLIILNFSLQDFEKLAAFEYHYGFLIFVCIIHFCNFTQLNCWMRNMLAILTALSFVGIALGQLGAISQYQTLNEMNVTEATAAAAAAATSLPPRTNHQNSFQAYHVEIYLDLMLVLVLVWFLNREFEIGYRLTFYGNAVANKDKIRVQNMKNQADMLLHNIIPKHVAEHLKNTAKYSENHRNIAIIFASIVNFNEFYDESYLGGKEYLRVLNELIGDFDELLSRPEFRCVEKIKTIGSTFMAASGLDPCTRGESDEHVVALMHFARAMQRVVDDFNKDLLEFNLVLRIGYNIGDVTAGVIGTSKLHYDIWGDAVNVASRMDSTGVAGAIQVGRASIPFLEGRFAFKARGKVYVKGKDHMEVFLLKVDGDNEVGEEEVALGELQVEEALAGGDDACAADEFV